MQDRVPKQEEGRGKRLSILTSYGELVNVETRESEACQDIRHARSDEDVEEMRKYNDCRKRCKQLAECNFFPELTQQKTRDMNSLRRLCRRMARSSVFEAIQLSAIMANAVLVSYRSDWQIKNMRVLPPVLFWSISISFTTFFSIEWLIRVIDEGRYFMSCFNANIKWNLFDTVSLVACLFEEVFTVSDQMPNVSSARILRVFRLLRILRILRVVHIFRDLRMLVHGILSSVKSLAWCMVL